MVCSTRETSQQAKLFRFSFRLLILYVNQTDVAVQIFM